MNRRSFIGRLTGVLAAIGVVKPQAEPVKAEMIDLKPDPTIPPTPIVTLGTTNSCWYPGGVYVVVGRSFIVPPGTWTITE